MEFLRVQAAWEEWVLERGESLAEAGKPTWTWFMTHLERRMQREYGKSQKIDVSHSATGELERRLHELNRSKGRATGD